MMKKLLLLGIVLAFCSSVMAAGHIELRVAPEDVNLAGYQGSDTITIQIYATGFYTNYPWDTIGTMEIAEIQTDNGGTASAPDLHDTLEGGTGISAGTIVNSGGVLIEDIRGYKEALDLVSVYPFPAVLWECEFHIPDVPASSIITISLDGLSLKNVGYNDPVPPYTVTDSLEITIGCKCAGDVDANDIVDVQYDLNAIIGALTWEYIFYGDWIIEANSPNMAGVECADTDANGVVDVQYDLNTLIGNLTWEYITNGVWWYRCGDYDP